jgi:ribosomal RNA assembly protein
MQQIECNPEEKNKIKKEQKMWEKKLNIKISYNDTDIIIIGDAFNEYIALDVLNAVALGFSAHQALTLLEADTQLKVIDLKKYVKESSFKRIMGRVIGQKGKAKKKLEQTTDVKISIKNSRIGVLGDYNVVNIVTEAIMKIIEGAAYSNVYRFIEKNSNIKKIGDQSG